MQKKRYLISELCGKNYNVTIITRIIKWQFHIKYYIHLENCKHESFQL
jgi:hypothetical protein